MSAPTHKTETIVALATPAGRGAIGIVRLSGPDIIAVAKSIMSSLPKPRYAGLRTLKNSDGESFDQALVLYFPGPGSFTGESMLEIQTHGGEAVISQLIEVCLSSGARLARPGEFSERAFLNGKIDLLQAEAISDLISSGSVRAARSAFNSLKGMFSDEVNEISFSLRDIRIEVEACIDFPEEEIPSESLLIWQTRLATISASLGGLLQSARQGAKLNRGADIAIVGRPNVGKSTLLNALAREEKAITSDIPGTTRDVVSVDIEFNGLNLRFHDTAGLRDKPADAIEKEGIRRTREILRNVDVCLSLSDNNPTFDSNQFIDLETELPEMISAPAVISVVNKIDLSHQVAEVVNSHPNPTSYISAKTRAGVDDLLALIVDRLGLNPEDESPFIARERHIAGLEAALELTNLNIDVEITDLELLAEKLRLAQRELGMLVGEYSSEDLLGDIFSTFCIGK
jgi:tRNA modification GTPase